VIFSCIVIFSFLVIVLVLCVLSIVSCIFDLQLVGFQAPEISLQRPPTTSC